MRRIVIHNHLPMVTDSRREFPDVLQLAQSIDPLRYLKGLKRLVFTDNIEDHWNASYAPESDEITISNKFHEEPFNDRVQILLHEGGHRGQMLIAPELFKEFLKRGLSQLPYFLAMANRAHREDFQKNGIGRSDMADEIFAESYSRFALDMPMPDPLREFWSEQR